MNISVEDIKKLREETGAGIADCREALTESKGDMAKAKEEKVETEKGAIFQKVLVETPLKFSQIEYVSIVK